jgi:hypothetical protein
MELELNKKSRIEGAVSIIAGNRRKRVEPRTAEGASAR